MCIDIVRGDDCWGNAGGTSATPSAESSYRDTGEPAAIRVSPSSDSRTKRSALIQSLGAMRTNRGDAMADTKTIGQPFMWKGSADPDFGEWSHKVRAFMLASFGDDILSALIWAAQQRKIVVKTCVASQKKPLCNLDHCYWRTSRRRRDREHRRFRWKALCLLGVFYNRRSKQDRSELRRRNGLEAWRRLNSEYGPTSSMKRVVILQQVQKRPRCQRVEDLGPALEEWLSKKRQYKMFTDRNGRPCQASDDNLMAAIFQLPQSPQETFVRQLGRGLPGVVRQTAGLQQHEAVDTN